MNIMPRIKVVSMYAFAPYKADRPTHGLICREHQRGRHLFPGWQARRGASNEQMVIHQKYLNIPGYLRTCDNSFAILINTASITPTLQSITDSII